MKMPLVKVACCLAAVVCGLQASVADGIDDRTMILEFGVTDYVTCVPVVTATFPADSTAAAIEWSRQAEGPFESLATASDPSAGGFAFTNAEVAVAARRYYRLSVTGAAGTAWTDPVPFTRFRQIDRDATDQTKRLAGYTYIGGTSPFDGNLGSWPDSTDYRVGVDFGSTVYVAGMRTYPRPTQVERLQGCLIYGCATAADYSAGRAVTLGGPIQAALNVWGFTPTTDTTIGCRYCYIRPGWANVAEVQIFGWTESDIEQSGDSFISAQLEVEHAATRSPRLTWRILNVDEVVVQWRLAGEEEWVDCSELPGTATDCVLTGLSLGVTHELRVCGRKGDEVLITRTMTFADNGDKVFVTQPKASFDAQGTARVTWACEAVDDCAVVVEWRFFGEDVWTVASPALEASVTSYDVTGLTRWRQYEFRVRATADGLDLPSSVARVSDEGVGVRLPGLSLTPAFDTIFDRLTSAFVDNNNNDFYFDAGTPKRIYGVRIYHRDNWYDRVKGMTVYGSNDNATWTRVARNEIPSTSLAYVVFPADADVAAYRYYRISGVQYGNAKELELLCDEVVLEESDPDPFAGTAVGSGDREEGVRMSGVLRHVPTGSADIRVFAAAEDYGDDYEEWLAHAEGQADLADVAEGVPYACDMTGLSRGRWHSRAFALTNGVPTASQQSFAFVVGSDVYTPPAYLASSVTTLGQVYDGETGSYPNTTSGNLYFDTSDLIEFGKVVAIRIWPRNGGAAFSNVEIWNRFRSLSVAKSDTSVSWTGATAWKTGERKIDLVSGEPTATWTAVATDVRDHWSHAKGGGNLAQAVTVVLKEPVAPAVLRISLGGGYWNVREVELRTLPKEAKSGISIRNAGMSGAGRAVPEPGDYEASEFTYPLTLRSGDLVKVDRSSCYDCCGYVVETQTDPDTWSDPVTNAATSLVLESAPAQPIRVTWLWRKAVRALGVPLDPAFRRAFDRCCDGGETYPSSSLSDPDIDFDAGLPRRATEVLATPVAATDIRNLAVFGSNDRATWTLVATNRGETLEGGDLLLRTLDGTAAYRYYRFKHCASAHAYDLAVLTPDLTVEMDRPAVFEGSAVGAADRADGVRVTGRLKNAVGGRTVSVFAARADYGADCESWRRNGVAVSAGEVTGEASFACSVPGLDKGVWYLRAFAEQPSGGVAAQQTFRCVVGTREYHPTGYLLGATPQGLAAIYDGNSENYYETDAGHVFLFDVSRAPGRIASIRIWPRYTSSTAVNRIWMRFGTLQISCNNGPVEWTNAADWRGGERPVRTAAALAGGSWRAAASDFDRFVDNTPVGFSLPRVLEFTFDRPLKTKVIRLTGPLYWNVGEVELRLMPKSGTVLMVK